MSTLMKLVERIFFVQKIDSMYKSFKIHELFSRSNSTITNPCVFILHRLTCYCQNSYILKITSYWLTLKTHNLWSWQHKQSTVETDMIFLVYVGWPLSSNSQRVDHVDTSIHLSLEVAEVRWLLHKNCSHCQQQLVPAKTRSCTIYASFIWL